MVLKKALKRIALAVLLTSTIASCQTKTAIKIGSNRYEKPYKVSQATLDRDQKKEQAEEFAEDRIASGEDIATVVGDMTDVQKQLYYASSKGLKVGVMVPLTGKFSSIGDSVMDAIALSVTTRKSQKVIFIPIDTKEEGIKDEANVKSAADFAKNLRVDVILGPVFSASTKVVADVLGNSGIPIISLSNDQTMAAPGVYIFGVSSDALILTMLGYARDAGMENIGFLFPSTTSGYKVSQKATTIASSLKLQKMALEYYPTNTDLFPATARRIMLARKQSYKIDETGTIQTINRKSKFKDSEKEKMQEFKNLTTAVREMQAVYIDAKGASLYKMIRELSANGAFDANMMILSSEAFLDVDAASSPYAIDSMLVASLSSGAAIETKQYFSRVFGYEPAKVSMLAYDASNLILYVLSKGFFSEKVLFSPNGYAGTCGEFRFTPSGLVQRKFGVYKVTKGRFEMVHKSPLFI